jgi:hemerythrin-like metal-binding protein
MIPWSNQFSVGVQEVDKQHQVLVGIVNRLGAALDGRNRDFDNRQVIDELLQYTVYHFGTEERLMGEISYAGLDRHVHEHQSFVKNVCQLVAQLDQGQGPSLEELLIFLRDWLVSHILNSDRDMGDALNLVGIR